MSRPLSFPHPIVPNLAAALGLLLPACTSVPVPVGLRATPSAPSVGPEALASSFGPTLRPVINRIDVRRGPTRQSVELTVEAVATDGGLLTYAWSFPGGTYSSNRGRTVVWTSTGVSQTTPVSVNLTVKVSDPRGESDTGTVGLTIGPDGVIQAINRTPAIARIQASRSTEGTLQFTAAASDPDGDDLTYTWYALRGSLSGSGPEVVWSPLEVVPTSEGVAVVVSDANGASARAAIAFRIDRTTGMVDLAPVHVGGPVQDAPPVLVRDLMPREGVTVQGLDLLVADVPGAPAPPPPDGLTLDAPDRDGTFDPRFTPAVPLEAHARLSNGQPHPHVLWSSSHPALARIGWDGVLRAQPDARAGSLVVTARSFLDPDQVATLSVTLRTLGHLSLEVR